MKPNLALFDFDGTITSKDTLFELIKFAKGNFEFYGFIILVSPWLVLLKLGVLSAQQTKEKLLRMSIGGLTIKQFTALCESFCSTQLPLILRNEAMQAIEKHISNGDKVVIVSASPAGWIEPWARLKNVEVIGTHLQIVDGLVTGNILGLNCNGSEKATRIKKQFNLSDFNKIYAYGDTQGDREMLALADFSFYRKFA